MLNGDSVYFLDINYFCVPNRGPEWVPTLAQSEAWLKAYFMYVFLLNPLIPPELDVKVHITSRIIVKWQRRVEPRLHAYIYITSVSNEYV